MSNISWRVKLYILTLEGQWDEKGTGKVSCQYNDSTGESTLSVVSEDGDMQLLSDRVHTQDVYHLQSENIITWTEAGDNGGETEEFALSFEDNGGCDDIWSTICGIKGHTRSETDMMESEAVSLPEAKMVNLPQIAEALTDVPPPHKDGIARAMLEQDNLYVRTLMDLIGDCSDLEDVVSLQHCFNIVKGIMALNEPTLLELILSDKYFPQFITALDYDPELNGQCTEHRVFLLEIAHHKEVIPVNDPEVLARIRQNFRIQYLKDTLLRRVVDDPAFNLINSLLVCNHVAIVTQLHNHTKFLHELFTALAAPDTGRERREELLAFLNELIGLSKYLQPNSREVFFKSLVEVTEDPFFDVFVAILDDPEASTKEKMHCTEVILSTICHDPAMLRGYLIVSKNHPAPPPSASSASGATAAVAQAATGAEADEEEVVGPQLPRAGAKGKGDDSKTGSGVGFGAMKGVPVGAAVGVGQRRPLLLILLQLLLEDDDTGVISQVSEIIRLLIDKETMEHDAARDELLSLFYDYYMTWMLEPLNLPRKSSSENSARSVAIKAAQYHCVELLSLCVQMHGYRIKYYVMRNNVVAKVLRMLEYKDKHLKLVAIRFLRQCIGLKDEFYNRHLVKSKLLNPVMDAFFTNGDRDNLLNSAVLELVEFIRSENVKSLVTYLVNAYRSQFEAVLYVPTFKQLVLKYDQNDEFAGNSSLFANKAAASEEQRREDMEGDDAYFNASDEEEGEDDEDDLIENGMGRNASGVVPAPVTVVAKSGDENEDEGLPAGLKPLVPYGSDSDEDDEGGDDGINGVFSGGGKGKRKRSGVLGGTVGRKRAAAAGPPRKIAFVISSTVAAVSGSGEGDGGKANEAVTQEHSHQLSDDVAVKSVSSVGAYVENEQEPVPKKLRVDA